MNPTQTTGTTLEILAPYLPYGIEVETGIDDGERERKQLHSLTQDGYPMTRLYGHEEAASFSDILPVLYSFEDLVRPLPDGTVPLKELAKITFALQENPGRALAIMNAKPVYHGEQVSLFISEVFAFSVTKYWDFAMTKLDEIMPCTFTAKMMNWLYANHFAVGLDPSQYIRKTHEPQPTL